jgi:hypothetical protein
LQRKPDFDAAKIALFLLDPHPKMPDMGLSRKEAADLAAYIATAKIDPVASSRPSCWRQTEGREIFLKQLINYLIQRNVVQRRVFILLNVGRVRIRQPYRRRTK